MKIKAIIINMLPVVLKLLGDVYVGVLTALMLVGAVVIALHVKVRPGVFRKMRKC